MFFFRRPAYFRWVVGAIIVAFALVRDLSGERSEPFPFAARLIPAGAQVTEADVTWRQVPAGLMPPASLEVVFATHDVPPGAPLAAGSVASRNPIPRDWWALPVILPDGIAAGRAVRLVSPDTGRTADGIVAAAGADSAFGGAEPGLVALPGDAAAEMAAAAARGDLVVMISP